MREIQSGRDEIAVACRDRLNLTKVGTERFLDWLFEVNDVEDTKFCLLQALGEPVHAGCCDNSDQNL